jgi:hypothetical protein
VTSLSTKQDDAQWFVDNVDRECHVFGPESHCVRWLLINPAIIVDAAFPDMSICGKYFCVLQ